MATSPFKLAAEDADLEAQLHRTAAATYSQSADLGEIAVTAQRISPSDINSWFTEWDLLAERTFSLGEASIKKQNTVTACKAYLRATEYWRQAIFYVRDNLDDPRLLKGWQAHRKSFIKAAALLPWHTTITNLPYESGQMRLYFMRPQKDTVARPTVLAPCGFDSTAEAGYAATAYMALPRGYNVILWEGPGQGGMLYEHHIPMRPDFEHALSPVIDWALTQPGVDPNALILIGRSFAGYFAARAAAFEHRLAALVLDPGQVEFTSRIVPALISQAQWQSLHEKTPDPEDSIEKLLQNPKTYRFYAPRMASVGVDNLSDFFRRMTKYTIEEIYVALPCSPREPMILPRKPTNYFIYSPAKNICIASLPHRVPVDIAAA